MGEQGIPGNGLTPEQQVVLSCARGSLTPSDARDIAEAVARGINWNKAMELAARHGVSYFLATHLLALGQEQDTLILPPLFERELRTTLWRGNVYGELLLEQQRRLNAELNQAGVPVLWLKGLALSMQLYGGHQVRQCGDLDLLCPAGELPAAEACLRRAGFRPISDPSGKDEHAMAAHHRSWLSDSADTPILVELHHRLSGPPACQPDVPTLLEHARCVSINGQAFPVPGLEHELLILCLHAHHHNFAVLRLLMDVAEYVTKWAAELDWPRFFEDAKRCRTFGRAQAALFLALASLRREGQPASALGRLQRWAIRDLTPHTLLQHCSHDDDVHRARLGLLMDSWGDVLRLLGPHLWPTRNYLRTVCPAPLGSIPGLAHLYHLGRISFRWLREAGTRQLRGTGVTTDTVTPGR